MISNDIIIEYLNDVFGIWFEYYMKSGDIIFFINCSNIIGYNYTDNVWTSSTFEDDTRSDLYYELGDIKVWIRKKKLEKI
jgi:hypothetical protein